MGNLYVLPTANTWQESLEQMKQNIDLLEANPDKAHLWHFIETCMDRARVQWNAEQDVKRAAEKAQS